MVLKRERAQSPSACASAGSMPLKRCRFNASALKEKRARFLVDGAACSDRPAKRPRVNSAGRSLATAKKRARPSVASDACVDGPTKLRMLYSAAGPQDRIAGTLPTMQKTASPPRLPTQKNESRPILWTVLI